MVPQIKIVLLGDQSVGKTSLLNKWISNSFNSDSVPTIGGAAQSKKDIIDNVTYNFQIWDTAGAEKYRSLTPLYARDSCAALVVFDLSKKESFDNLEEWVEFLHQQGDIPFVVVGNKDDLVDKIQVSSEDATNYVFSVGAQYFNVSARTGSGVDLAFRALEMCAIEFYKKVPHEEIPVVEGDMQGNNDSSGCC